MMIELVLLRFKSVENAELLAYRTPGKESELKRVLQMAKRNG